MKFGVREICDVVLRAKSAQKIGNKIFYKNEPVIYFDTLKTSSVEGAATTVYAQGGRGNARLVSWDGERTVTFTMEDALISPEGFSILSGAGLVAARDAEGNSIKQHLTETISIEEVDTKTEGQITFYLAEKPYMGKDPTITPASKDASGKTIEPAYCAVSDCREEHYIYAMFKKDDEIISEPFVFFDKVAQEPLDVEGKFVYKVVLKFDATEGADSKKNKPDFDKYGDFGQYEEDGIYGFDSILVDYYTERTTGAQQIEITPDKFGGAFYLEASTLFRTQNGVDMPAEFIIPNCRIQSNFNFTMASSGDPSTFTFTMDAFPDYTRFDHSKKVLACIQMIDAGATNEAHRDMTWSEDIVDSDGIVWEDDCPLLDTEEENNTQGGEGSQEP